MKQIQSLECINNCFCTNKNHRNKLHLPSHTVRCKCSNPCWCCCHPLCWRQMHLCPCDPRLCCRKLRLCDAGCIDGHASNSSCRGKVCWWTTMAKDFLVWPRGGLVCSALASTSASFLLATVSMVTDKERAKLDVVSCWRTVVLLAPAGARLSRAVPSRSIVAAGAGIIAWALPNGPPPPQTLEVGAGV